MPRGNHNQLGEKNHSWRDGASYPIELVCKNCTTVFVGRPRRERPGCDRFCSPECHYDYTNRQRERVCDFCGNPYIPKQKRKNKHQFCKPECYKLWLSVVQKGVANPQISKALKGVPFTKERRIRHRLTCRRGKDHPMWKGGVWCGSWRMQV